MGFQPDMASYKGEQWGSWPGFWENSCDYAERKHTYL